jgi:hypothetical protein
MTNWIICESKSLPKKQYLNPYYPSIKTRYGKKSIPFMDLNAGYHFIEFRTRSKFMQCKIKSWLSIHGWAWEIFEIINEGKLK